jgi:nucleoside-diphosphate-sugar epimerase
MEEQGCRPEARHYNEYTRTKAQAEQLLRQSGLPSLIVRPSIVLSAGLAERRFAMNILWCLPLLNLLGAAPIHPDSRLDFVTIEFVVESLIKLLRLPQRRHQCYHLSAGETGSITARRLEQFLHGFYGRTERAQLFPQAEWTSALKRRFVQTQDQRFAAIRLRPYLPFMNMNTVFDNRRLRAELADTMPHNPDPLSYMGTLLGQFSLADALAASRNP